MASRVSGRRFGSTKRPAPAGRREALASAINLACLRGNERQPVENEFLFKREI